MSPARILGVAIVAAPIASAVLLGLGWAALRLIRAIRGRDNR